MDTRTVTEDHTAPSRSAGSRSRPKATHSAASESRETGGARRSRPTTRTRHCNISRPRHAAASACLEWPGDSQRECSITQSAEDAYAACIAASR